MESSYLQTHFHPHVFDTDLNRPLLRPTNPSMLARQITTLDGCKALRSDRSTGRKGIKWSQQLDSLCDKVFQLSLFLKDGDHVNSRLIRQVEQRLDKVAKKRCLQSDRQQIERAQRNLQLELSPNGCLKRLPDEPFIKVFQPQTKLTRSPLGLLLLSLYFQGVMGGSAQTSFNVSQPHSQDKPQDDGIARWTNFWETVYPVEPIRIPDCLTSDCPEVNANMLHPREGCAINKDLTSFIDRFFKTHQEWLRFRKDDVRKKLLYLSAEADHNGALTPAPAYRLLTPLNEKYDIKYVVFRSFDGICEHIKQSAKIENISHVFISGHGNPDLIRLSDRFFGGAVTKNDDFSECFDHVSASGTISLVSCSTGGGDSQNSFAQHLASSSRRMVIAPTDVAYPILMQTISTEPPMLFHDREIDYWDSKERVWKIFRPPEETHFRVFFPKFSSCNDLAEKRLHLREKEAINAISAHLIKKHFLWTEPAFSEMQDYLRVCEQNPKRKFLYLSAEDCSNKSNCPLDPKYFTDLLVKLGQEFDLKFKVIKRYDDICTEVRETVKAGEVAGIVVNAFGNTDGFTLLNDRAIGWMQHISEWLFGEPELFPKCLSETSSNTRIFFIGGSTGAAQNWDPNANLAYRVAQASKRTVFAPDRPIYTNAVKLSSINPIELDYERSIFSSNPFKKFEPK